MWYSPPLKSSNIPEGDCFFIARNPYIPPDTENPSIAQSNQRKLIGEGATIRKQLGNAADEAVQVKMVEKEWKDFSVLESVYGELCKDILRERRRMGGDWVVATLLMDRQIRDFVRYTLISRISRIISTLQV